MVTLQEDLLLSSRKLAESQKAQQEFFKWITETEDGALVIQDANKDLTESIRKKEEEIKATNEQLKIHKDNFVEQSKKLKEKEAGLADIILNHDDHHTSEVTYTVLTKSTYNKKRPRHVHQIRL